MQKRRLFLSRIVCCLSVSDGGGSRRGSSAFRPAGERRMQSPRASVAALRNGASYTHQSVGFSHGPTVMFGSWIDGGRQTTVTTAQSRDVYASRINLTEIALHCVPKERPPFYFSNNSIKN